MGRHREALQSTQEAVSIQRQLVRSHPELQDDLALALTNQSQLLRDLGREDAALLSAVEALQLRRQLVKAHGGSRSELASALQAVGLRSLETGRAAEALPPLLEALQLRRLLAAADPTQRPNLAATLNSLGLVYGELERRADAVLVAEESMGIRQSLAQADPSRKADFARSLLNLGKALAAVDRREEALRVSEQAVSLYSQISAVEQPDRSELAAALTNLGVRYSELGRPEKALGPSAAAVQLYGKLAASNPRYLRELGVAQANLAVRYRELGRRQEALASTQDAVRTQRKLNQELPTVQRDLSRSLINLGTQLSVLGRHQEALPPALEAVRILRRLASVQPGVSVDLAHANNNLAMLLNTLGHRQDALLASQEAVQLYRRLAQDNPAFQGDLAASLSNLGSLFSEVGRRQEALGLSQEAVRISRERARVNPQARGGLARDLNNLGADYSALGRHRQALATRQEALAVVRELARDNPAFLEEFARTATNLAETHLRLNNPMAALPLLRERLSSEVTDLQSQLPLLPEGRRLALLAVYGERWQIPFYMAQLSQAGAELALFTRLNRQGLLQDIQRSQALLARNGPQRPLFEQLTAVTAQLASTTLTPQQQASLLERKEQLEQELYRQLPQIKPRLVEPGQIAAVLPKAGRLLEFQRYRYSASAPPRYLALLLRPDGTIRVVQLGEAAPIDAAVAVAVAASADPKRQVEAPERLAVVSRLVLAPLQQELVGVRELFVSPDGELNRLPFAALPLAAAAAHAPKAQPSEGRRPEAPRATSAEGTITADGPTLGEVVALRLLTTGRELLRLQQPAKAGGPAVLIANPDFNAPSRNAPSRNALAHIASSRSHSGTGSAAVRRPAQPSNTSAAAPSARGASASARGAASASAAGTERASAVGASSPADSSHGATPLPGSQQRSPGVRGLTPWQPRAGTEQEARQRAPLLGVSAVIRGPAATAAVVLAQRAPRILHIATHGFFLADQASASARASRGAAATSGAAAEDSTPASASREDPLQRSGLVFAGANRPDADPNDDGYLTAAEATAMELEGTELVTLSACETGLGGVQSGEGVYGLQRSLAVAGARSTLLSLWKVDDALTVTFMQSYYNRLKAGEGRAEALRHTQSEFRNHKNSTYNDIRVWGAFQLSGDWRALPRW
ncbi:MAG: CHAT domain-containing protein [Synechococcaceae cyanobacterium]